MRVWAPLWAHARWIAELREYVYDHSGGFDPTVAGRDDCCELGRWLRRDAAPYRDLVEHQNATAAHVAFHRCAAKVVVLADQGHRREAEAEVADGGCLRLHSRALVRACNRLNRRIKEIEGTRETA